MYPRVNYEMTEEDFEQLLDASRSTPVMYLPGGIPMRGTPQENANAAWAQLGKKMGFDHMTVQPIPGKGSRFFSAVPTETEAARKERFEREAEEAKTQEIARLSREIEDLQARLKQLRGADAIPKPS